MRLGGKDKKDNNTRGLKAQFNPEAVNDRDAEKTFFTDTKIVTTRVDKRLNAGKESSPLRVTNEVKDVLKYLKMTQDCYSADDTIRLLLDYALPNLPPKHVDYIKNEILKLED